MGPRFGDPKDAERFRVFFQPILELRRDALCLTAFEALVREDPAPETPGETGDAAAGISREGALLDLQRLALALDQAGRLPDSVSISLNVRLGTLAALPRFSEVFLAIAGEHGIRPERLILEIIAQKQAPAGNAVAQEARILQRHKVRLALDDFGQGCSNLDLLADVRPDLLKLSALLTRDLMDDPGRQHVLASFLHLGRQLGARTLVKGLGSLRDFRAARWLGANLVQGYLFGVPGPIELWEEHPFPAEWPLRSFMRSVNGTDLGSTPWFPLPIRPEDPPAEVQPPSERRTG